MPTPNGIVKSGSVESSVIFCPGVVIGTGEGYVDTTVGAAINLNERWINSGIGDDANSSSILKPLKTISAGFTGAVSFPLRLTIFGSFNDFPDSLVAGNSNLQITAPNGWEAQQSEIVGQTIKTEGAMTRLKMSNFHVKSLDKKVLEFTDTEGRHAFSNMHFSSTHPTPITFTDGFKNWCYFQDCDFTGLTDSTSSPSVYGLTLTALPANISVTLRLFNCGIVNLSVGSGWVVYISGSTTLTTSSSLSSGQIVQLPNNHYNAVLTAQPSWSTLPPGVYINMVGDSLSVVTGTPSLGCAIIKMAAGSDPKDIRVSLSYNQLPPSINVYTPDFTRTVMWVKKTDFVGWFCPTF